jgi:ABC-type methionine transport system ATPase subunit
MRLRIKASRESRGGRGNPAPPADYAVTTYVIWTVLALLADINQRLNLTIVLITHELEVVKTLCDHAALLEHGEVIESGKIADLLVAPWTI